MNREQIAEVEQTVRNCLADWPLYNPETRICVVPIAKGLSIGLGLASLFDRQRLSWTFDVNVLDDVFYVLFLQIAEQHRGKGLGAELYRRLESLATKLGCRQIRMTPSGWTPTGETRLEWMLRRGYKQDGVEVYKDLPCQDSD